MNDAPTCQRIGDVIYVAWARRYVFSFGHFQQAPWGLQAELSVTAPETGLELAWGQVQLTSTESRGKLAKRLDAEPAGLLDLACRAALGCWREPPAWIDLGLKPLTAIPWFWTDWIPANQTTVLYADGDTGKSLLALTLAVCALTGLPFAGTWPIATAKHVLYIDYESSPEDHEHRLALICRALEVPTLEGLHYLPAAQPIGELVPTLKAARDRYRAELVILDSASMASGGEPESARAALEWVSALRQLAPATRIALAHVSKASMAIPGQPRQAYGSVQVRNGPRCSLDMRRQGDAPSGLHVTLHVNKNNLLHHKPPDIALSLEAEDDGIVWRKSDRPAVRTVPIIDQLLAILPEVEALAMSSATASATLKLDIRAVRKALERGAGEQLVRSVAQGGKGKGDDTTWIRIVTKRDKRDRISPDSATPWDEDPGH